MMITKIQLAAMSRVDVPEKERKDFYLYIDEFQNFSTDSFANILSEARKYHLNLILAHQYIEQLSEKVKPAVFGNVGTIIAFRVGAADAEELAKEFAPVFTEEDLVNLPKYEMYLKLMIDGVASSPFSAKGLPPLSDEEKTNNVDQVIAYSRKKYASSRAEVEEKILRWHEAQDDIPSTPTRPVAPASPLFAMSPKSLEAKTGVSTISQPTIARQSAEKNIERGKTTPSSSPKLQERLIFQGTNTAAAPIKQASVYQSSALVFGIRAVKNPSAAKGYHAICSRCGAETTTVFVPDGIRPVFCKDCLSLKRQERKREEDNRRQAKAEELQALKNIPNPSPSLSLSSLRQARPVDFRGRPEKIVPPIKKNDFQEEGQDMAEDELIDFSRRPE